MIQNCIEIFGQQHSWTYQIKNYVHNDGEAQAEIVYRVMISSEKQNTKIKIKELEEEIEKLKNKLDKLKNM